MAKGDDIDARLSMLSAHLLDACDLLPRTPKGSHIGSQLMRCGTAGGANYAEARAADSREDFIHKLAIVLKDLNETRYCLGGDSGEETGRPGTVSACDRGVHHLKQDSRGE